MPPLRQNQDGDEAKGLLVRNRMGMRNLLRERILENGLIRRRIPFNILEDPLEGLLDFPILTIEQLGVLTMGPYQLRLAPGYIKAHMGRNGRIVIEIHRDDGEDGERIIRARIPSRYL